MLDWPVPCPKCGSRERQEYKWAKGSDDFRQVCHDCGHDGDWEPWPGRAERKVGYTYSQLQQARESRASFLRLALRSLHSAYRLSLHHPPLRDELQEVQDRVQELLDAP